MDLSKMKVIDLKLELKKRGLTTTGNKNELQDRLQMALLGGGNVLDDTGADDLLDDDLMDDELDEKELLGHDEHEDELLKESPSPDASEKKHGFKPKQHSAASISSSTSDMAAESTTTQVPHKKISLKRNLSVPKPVLPETTTSTGTDEEGKSITSTNGSDKTAADEPDKKVVKLTQLSSEERLKLRAQKFGASGATETSPTTAAAASDDKKLARAARFGISSTTTSSVSIKSSAPEVSVEVLKKRAERFGASTAPKLNAIELDEKLKKRQERFGATTTLPSDQAEKARLRLERFKTAA